MSLEIQADGTTPCKNGNTKKQKSESISSLLINTWQEKEIKSNL